MGTTISAKKKVLGARKIINKKNFLSEQNVGVLRYD